VQFGNKPPFRAICYVEASKASAEVKTIHEPLDLLHKGSSVFLVQAAEGRYSPEYMAAITES